MDPQVSLGIPFVKNSGLQPNLTFSPHGKHVDEDGMLRLWNVRTLKLVREWRVHPDLACCVAFTPDDWRS